MAMIEWAAEHTHWCDAASLHEWRSSGTARPSSDRAQAKRWVALLAMPAFQEQLQHLEHQKQQAIRTAAASRVELDALKGEVEELRQRLARLEGEVVVVREITREEAKREVLGYFRRRRRVTYPSDAAAALRLDAALVRDLCHELEQEGRLGR